MTAPSKADPGVAAGPGVSTPAPRRRSLVRERIVRSGIVYALALLVLVLAVVAELKGQPSYLRPENVANILAQTAPIALLAVFQTIVLLTGNFDISIASTTALASLIVLTLAPDLGILTAVALALVVGGAIGALNGVLVEKVGVNSFIVTLGMLTAVRGLVLVLTGGESVATDVEVADPLAEFYYTAFDSPNLLLVAGVIVLAALAISYWHSKSSGTQGKWKPGRRWIAGAVLALGLLGLGLAYPYVLAAVQPVWLVIVVALAVWLVLRFTVLGRRVYAVGGSREAARLSGIRVQRYKIGAFIAMGVAAGLAGIIFAAQLTSLNPTSFQGLEFTVLTAAILGGTSLYGGSGDVLKSVAGALFLFTLINGFNALNLGAIWQQLVEGVVIITAVALYTVASRTRDRAAA